MNKKKQTDFETYYIHQTGKALCLKGKLNYDGNGLVLNWICDVINIAWQLRLL